MKQYLHFYISYLQNDWTDWLLITEFTVNNTIFKTMKISSFLTNSGQHSRLSYEPATEIQQSVHQQAQTVNENKFINFMKKIKNYLKQEMTWSQTVYKKNVNWTWISALTYQVEDTVWLNIWNLKMKHPSKKLNWKNADLF